MLDNFQYLYYKFSQRALWTIFKSKFASNMRKLKYSATQENMRDIKIKINNVILNQTFPCLVTL